MSEQRIPINGTNMGLRSFEQSVGGLNVQVEAVSLVDPSNTSGQMAVVNSVPVGGEYGAVIYIGGVNASAAFPVTGTFFQATQPVSIASAVAVTGTFFQATQPVSAASLPLPSDASTETTLSTLNGKVTACNTGAVVLATGSATIGAVTDGGSGKTLKSAVLSLAATGTVVAAVASKRIKVYAVKAVVGAALSINFRDGGTTALEGAQVLAINGGYVESVDPPNFLFATTSGNSLDMVVTGVGTVAGRVSYWDDDAT